MVPSKPVLYQFLLVLLAQPELPGQLVLKDQSALRVLRGIKVSPERKVYRVTQALVELRVQQVQ